MKNNSFKKGRQYLIRTVTHYHIGKLSAITESDLVLKHASWVADTGRFYDALKNGELSEVEPFVGKVIVSRAAIIDATEWTHKLPKAQK